MIRGDTPLECQGHGQEVDKATRRKVRLVEQEKQSRLGHGERVRRRRARRHQRLRSAVVKGPKVLPGTQLMKIVSRAKPRQKSTALGARNAGSVRPLDEMRSSVPNRLPLSQLSSSDLSATAPRGACGQSDAPNVRRRA